MLELVYIARENAIEELSEALEMAGALSVSVEDAEASQPEEAPLFGEPGMPPPSPGWQNSLVKALFSTLDDAEQAAANCATQEFFSNCTVLGITTVPDEDWVRLTQAQFEPVRISDTFWIVPSWHEAPLQAVNIIRLDPGLAFGTGTHPTTQMCLRWIGSHTWANEDQDPIHVLDYGCGSGILAIGAAMFCDASTRSHAITGVDLDESAVAATRLNADRNGVQLLAGLPQMAAGLHSVVVANILAKPLTVLAPLLCSYVRPGGNLVLAGILDNQAQELIEAYKPWCALEVRDSQDGWIMMTARFSGAGG